METKTKYLITLFIGFLLGIIMTCDRNPQTVDTQTVTDTVYKISEQKTTLTDTIIKNKFIVQKQELTNLINEITSTKNEIKENLIEKYKYKIDTTYHQQKSDTQLVINGWGYVDDIKLNTTYRDTTKVITNTTTITKIKPSNGLYLSGEYVTPLNKNNSLEPIYKANLDYVKGRLIVGGSIGVQDNEPYYGVKLGFKIN